MWRIIEVVPEEQSAAYSAEDQSWYDQRSRELAKVLRHPRYAHGVKHRPDASLFIREILAHRWFANKGISTQDLVIAAGLGRKVRFEQYLPNGQATEPTALRAIQGHTYLKLDLVKIYKPLATAEIRLEFVHATRYVNKDGSPI